MKIKMPAAKKPRIEMVPMIDIIFLLLVFFIYAMLSMAVHRGVSLSLPSSDCTVIDQKLVLSVSIKADGKIFLDKMPITMTNLAEALKAKATAQQDTGVLLFADKSISYQQLFNVLDLIQQAGLERISLQAKVSDEP
ncbi:MAG: biopolymer transporter ExbD [Desulfobacterales bacterium]|jgi:biopolymer transport protein ExbD|nr:biopolymer transporter ExbD [Desulfobacterales bacterium]